MSLKFSSLRKRFRNISLHGEGSLVRVLESHTCKGVGEGGLGKRKVECDGVATGVSDESTRRSGAGMAILRQGCWALYHFCPDIRCQLSLRKTGNLARFLWSGKFLRRVSTMSWQQTALLATVGNAIMVQKEGSRWHITPFTIPS